MAIRSHPKIQAAAARINQLELEIRIAKASYYPRLTASAMDSSGLGGSSSGIGITGIVNSPYRKNEAIGVDTAWNIYDFGRTTYRVQAAQEKLKGAQADMEKIKQDLRLRLAEQFFRCAKEQVLLSMTLEQVQDQNQIIREVERYVRSGLRSPVELNLMKAPSEGILARGEDVRTRLSMALEDLRETDHPSLVWVNFMDLCHLDERCQHF